MKNLTVEQLKAKQALIEQYEKRSREHFQFYEQLQSKYRKEYGRINPVKNRMRALLSTGNYASPSEYVLKEEPGLLDALYPKHRAIFLAEIDRVMKYPYGNGWERRPFRSKNLALYTDKIMSVHNNLLQIGSDCDLNEYLQDAYPEDEKAYKAEHLYLSPYCASQVCYALDNGDEKAKELIRTMILEDNRKLDDGWELFEGIVRSDNAEFHKLLGDLLLAARLQEGLRQSVCERVDDGTAEGFLSILKVIKGHDLIRYSSIKRAVGVWLGLVSEETRDLDRIGNKSVELIDEYLRDERAREEGLRSEDSMKIYIALWAYAFFCVEDAIDRICGILENGTRHQLLTAGVFARNIQDEALERQLAKAVVLRYRDDTELLAVWLPLLKNDPYHWDHVDQKRVKNDLTAVYKDKEEATTFYETFFDLFQNCEEKTKTFSPCVFPWFEATLSRSDLAENAAATAALLGNLKTREAGAALIKHCDASHRSIYIEALLSDPQSSVLRRYLIEALADKETYARQTVAEIAMKCSFSEDEYRLMEKHLRFKNAELRLSVINLLMKQSDEGLESSVRRLLQSDKEETRCAGLDIVVELSKQTDKKALFTRCLTAVKALNAASLSAKEKLLVGSLLPDETEDKDADENALHKNVNAYLPTSFDENYLRTCAETFMKYFPDSRLIDEIGDQTSGRPFTKPASALGGEKEGSATYRQASADALALSKYAEEHRYEQEETEYGETRLLGAVLDRYYWWKNTPPFAALWENWYKTQLDDPARLVRAWIASYSYENKRPFATACAPELNRLFGAGFGHPLPAPYKTMGQSVLSYLVKTFVPKSDLQRLASAILGWFLRSVPDEKAFLRKERGDEEDNYDTSPVASFFRHPQLSEPLGYLGYDKEHFAAFALAVAAENKCRAQGMKLAEEDKKNAPTKYAGHGKEYAFTGIRSPELKEYLRAHVRGNITKEELYRFIFLPDKLGENLEFLTGAVAAIREKDRAVSVRGGANRWWNKKSAEELQKLIGDKPDDAPAEEDGRLIALAQELYDAVMPIVIGTEVKRGDTPTRYSAAIKKIKRIYGAENFVAILNAMGKDTLSRSTNTWYASTSRKDTLSHLLGVCVPNENDDVAGLEKQLASTPVTNDRLIEGALYSTEWIDIVGEYLQILGFRSACFYFIAHMNESFDDRRKAIVAKYTPLSEDELNLGAFDVAWFRSAYETCGEKTFDKIYAAAKYISDGAKHARARKYADATLGKYAADELEPTLSDKRNKDLLMAYALIPLDGGAEGEDVTRRYLFLQRFLKESKKFGAMRIAAEKKAVEIAMKNLATNAGFSDVMRLTLRMESKIVEEKAELFVPYEAEGVTVRLIVDDDGKAELTFEKGGKPLRSVPAKLKKDERIAQMTELKKTLIEQRRRARSMLEEGMEDGAVFTLGELKSLSSHPVVYPMLKKTVFVTTEKGEQPLVGFLGENGLIDPEGGTQVCVDETKVRIAHPLDLYGAGNWSAYQKRLFETKTVQPFRQVFRELYVKTDEELEAFSSMRYAGHQLQPARTVGALKARRWIADVEDGLQKVYYKENVIARIYALADWFSPADIEAPTLEWVDFTDRKTGKPIRIKDVPDLLFSEVMRDVDLAVSVAHAGGVDPETSHSTIEMRAALLQLTLPLFRLENVRVEGQHALIKGSLAEYSVHLGSGVVHQICGAMLNVLPVHSQHRGKLFLPFADDDPKTAEILSKVLLLAEDNKLKDPTILSQIRTEK